MKNVIIVGVIALIAGCYGNTTHKTGLEGKKMPNLTFLKMDSTKLIDDSVTFLRQPTVFFYFSPTCPYCRAMTHDLVSEVSSLGNLRFYLISNSSLSDMNRFSNQFQLNKSNNIILLQDNEGSVLKYFKITSVPYAIVFDGDRKVKRVFEGKTPISLLKEIALEQ